MHRRLHQTVPVHREAEDMMIWEDNSRRPGQSSLMTVDSDWVASLEYSILTMRLI